MAYTVDKRLEWLEVETVRRTDVLHNNQEFLRTNHDTQNEAIRQVHERQEEDHKLILSLEKRVQENNELLKGIGEHLNLPVHVQGPILPLTQSGHVQASSQAVASTSGPHVSEMIPQASMGATGLNATRGSAPGQATGQAASRPAQATSRRAPALLEDLGVSYAQAAGSSAPHPQAASPPDLMDVDQQPLPASAMPSMSPEVQAPPTPA